MSNKGTLIAHCGAHLVTNADVRAVETPEATRTWAPVAHEALIDLVLGMARNNFGLEIVDQQHALTRDGGNYFGLFEVSRADWGDPDYGTVIGLRNSHKMQFKALMAAGGHVFVCDNLSFSGEVVVGRKHTTNIMRDLPDLVSDAVATLIGPFREGIEQRFEHYKGARITDRTAEHLMIEMIRRDIVPPSKIEKVIEEWDEPSHEEFREGGRTAWRLFNAGTEALKLRGIAQPKWSQRLHTLVDEATEFKLAA